MYINSSIANHILNKYGLDKCAKIWTNGLKSIGNCIDCIDAVGNANPSETDFAGFDDVNKFTKDVVKSIKLFDGSDKIKRKSTLKIVSKIASHCLFIKDIEISKKQIVVLLDFINWNCELLFEDIENWIS